jgi:class 3 adenylate cyclase/tetratricopeptide (TPR) repeat protein
MIECASCGRQNPPDSRFCSGCGSPFDTAAPATAREERKVVTVVFVDLVGFTSRAERLDPEDVRAFLSPYYARLRTELERYGGTVEKFIGDAVMALFGAPAAHEDDPERAVRAALTIRDWVRDDETLQVRIAVNTGDALISLDARPSEGEGMATGDVVNTAARLQTAAPVNGILVGERTYRATRDAIEYRAAGRVAAKGKEAPLAVWEALEARARQGVDVPVDARTELFGRDRELEILRVALRRVLEEGSPQLVTLVGVPGIGKSRLLYELSQIVDSEPELVSWRQGRSLPYGEGVSFWALAEIVKSQAGILETDEVEEAGRKLGEAVSAVVPDPAEAGWVRRHLAGLVGLTGEPTELGGDRRSEAFAAWRRFLEALAEQRPLVLVFEDLHWADDGLLDFVDHFVDWTSRLPVYVVATARPELLERRPTWGGGKTNATTLSLAPLAETETARLIASVLGRPLLDAGEQAALLERVGGNPLYAEQYAQMLTERGGDADLPLPESIQGIVGARLDALPPSEKQLLQDAAVIGKVFWAGAVAALGDFAEPARLAEALHALERKQFLRRDRRSSVAEETQYVFSHLLLRDVAYGQIPRASRAEKHLRAAVWIDALGRGEDHAEMLAHHYVRALEFAQAVGRTTDEIVPRARIALANAGDRARSLNAFSASIEFYRQALALSAEDAREERADLLFRLAAAMFEADEDGRDAALFEARDALLEVGDRERAAEMESLLAQFAWMQGAGERCFTYLERAHKLVDTEPPSPAKARVLSQVSRYQSLAGRFDADVADEALELAETLDLDEIRAQILITIATARFHAGETDFRSYADRGLELALAGNRIPVIIRAYSALASFHDAEGDLHEADRIAHEIEAVAERLRGRPSIRWARGNTITMRVELGAWDECAAETDSFLADSAREGAHYHDAHVQSARAMLRLARGDVDGALADDAEALTRARDIADPQCVYPVLAFSAGLLADAGLTEEATGRLTEGLFRGSTGVLYAPDSFAWAAERLGRQEEVEALLPPPTTKRLRAARAVATRDFVEAAAVFDSMGAQYSAARARLVAAEELVDAGRRAEAEEQLREALAFFRSVGATRFVRRGETLLAAAS